MKILVTGASGQFGRRAAERLLEILEPGELVLVSRRPESLADFARRGVEVRAGDFDQPHSLDSAFAGIDRLLLISTDSVGAKRRRQHGNAIAALKRTGVGHVVYTSFIGASVDNPAISASEHGATEALLRATGIPCTFLRDSQYSEAIAQFVAPDALLTGRWMTATGEGQIGLVSREDCVACAVAVLTGSGHENKVYNLTGPELLSYRQCAQLTAEYGGRPVEYIPCSEEQKYAFFDALGVPRKIEGDGPIAGPIPWPSEEMVSFERALREGYFAVLSDDVKTLIGRPPISLRQIFEQYSATIQAAVAAQSAAR